jgi:hypothetical protein
MNCCVAQDFIIEVDFAQIAPVKSGGMFNGFLTVKNSVKKALTVSRLLNLQHRYLWRCCQGKFALQARVVVDFDHAGVRGEA